MVATCRSRGWLPAAAVLVGALLATACKRADEAPTARATSRGPAAHAAPARIVTLSPSATEVVAALGADADLVGVDDFSAYPAAVRTLPKIGSFLAPNVEVIVGLHPSLVIVDDVHTQVAETLGGIGIRTATCAMHSLPDVKTALTTVGAALGRGAQAKAITAAIDRALDDTAAARPSRRPRVLLIIDHETGTLNSLVAAGNGTWLDELLAVAGGQNVLTGAGIRYPKIGPEEVLRLQPDVILDVAFAAGGDVTPWHDLDVPAVRDHRVIVRADAFLLAPSPRVAEALAVLHDVVSGPTVP